MEALRTTADATGVQSCMAASADDIARAQCFARLATAAADVHAPTLAVDERKKEEGHVKAPRVLQEGSPFFDPFACEKPP